MKRRETTRKSWSAFLLSSLHFLQQLFVSFLNFVPRKRVGSRLWKGGMTTDSRWRVWAGRMAVPLRRNPSQCLARYSLGYLIFYRWSFHITSTGSYPPARTQTIPRLEKKFETDLFFLFIPMFRFILNSHASTSNQLRSQYRQIRIRSSYSLRRRRRLQSIKQFDLGFIERCNNFGIRRWFLRSRRTRITRLESEQDRWNTCTSQTSFH